MKRFLAVSVLVVLAGAVSCGDSSNCSYDTDCPDNQICMDGICKLLDPCAGVQCPPGEVCSNGICLSQQPDGGQPDGGDPDGSSNPCAGVTCPPGQMCDNGTCIEVAGDCVPVTISPVSQAPFECNDQTPCESCALYQGKTYHCRSLNGGPPMFLIINDQAPCDPLHACATIRCEGLSHYCLGSAGYYVEGNVPTADPELCNGVDDNCDGNTDEGAGASCPPVEGATVQCIGGSCSYSCNLGFHDCAGVCKDNSSPESCGDRCDPCPPPINGVATCEYQQCGQECHDGSQPINGECFDCNSDDRCGPECLPCDDGESCCEGGCIDTTDDPLNCGGCGWNCGSEDHVCCDGEHCCAPDTPECCGNFCCDYDGYCCPGDYCCPAGGECCGEFCCPPPHTTCCPGGCCLEDSECCHDFCCPDNYPECCDEGCCASGYSCCGAGCCSPDTYCCMFGLACCEKGDEQSVDPIFFPIGTMHSPAPMH